MVSLSITTKFWLEYSYEISLAYLSRIMSIPLIKLVQLEWDFLNIIDFNLIITSKDVYDWINKFIFLN